LKNRRGITFISLIIAVFVLAVGIAALLKVYPVISGLSEKAKGHISVSLIADRIFALIEKVYGDAGGPAVPPCLSGIDEEFPIFSYFAEIEEEKEDLYGVNIEISWEKEGKIQNEYFSGKFRRK